MTTPPATVPASSTELHTLLDRLAAQQHRVIGILAELDEDAMRRVILPSRWSCAGMVQHLTRTTRFWLVAVMTGKRDRSPAGDDVDADDFDVSAAPSSRVLIAEYARACRRGAALVGELLPSTAPAWWPEGRWGRWRLENLTEVLLHLLVETSTHAGHLDVVRELIDGRTWDYPHGRLSEACGTQLPTATSRGQ